METAAVSRGQNVVFVLPPDWSLASTFLAPAADRLDPADAGVQLVVVAEDTDAAIALAEAANEVGRGRGLRAMAATAAPRAARTLRAHGAHIVIGSAEQLVGLLKASALKLEGVRTVVLAWPDDATPAQSAALEALMAEIPKEAPRTIVARELSGEIEALIERYARRARRVLPADDEVAGLPVQYLTVADALRSVALRRLLDELNPPSAFVYARDPISLTEAQATLETLGYAAEGAVRAGTAATDACDTVVLYDLPATRAELKLATGGHAQQRVIALIRPRQLTALRQLAGAASAFVLPDAAARARAREDKLRDALREVLVSGSYTRELLALEPMLGEWDGIEIAAAALRLLEVAQKRAAEQRPAAPGRMARVFLNVGEQDGVRAGDIVGAVTGNAGLGGSDVGKVEIRDRFSLVEVSEAVVDAVCEKLTGVTVKGRQLIARRDEGRPERAPRGRGDDRGARPSRPRFGSRDEGGERPSRPRFSDRGEGGERPSRPRFSDRGDRPSRPRSSDRGDRPRPPRTSRPPRREGDGE
jgi:ATP-dependent RNA helicase DeaD